MKNFGEIMSILGGDFNFYFNENLDKQSQRKNRRNNTRCKQLVAQFMLENDLIDIWRVLNPNDKQFTCHRSNPPSKSRIDFFLTSHSVLEDTMPAASIVEGYLTDHKMCCLSASLTPAPRGGSFWKFNNSLLGDEIFVSECKYKMKEIIEDNESDGIAKTLLLSTVLCVLERPDYTIC